MKQNHRHREDIDGCQMEGVLGDWVKKLQGLSTNWQLQNSHEDVKYSVGNTVNNIVITMHGARLVLEI